MRTKEIYLVRHGKVVNNGSNRYIGQIDIPLNGCGRRQAARLRDELAHVPFSRVYCSDLARSTATAGIICGNYALEPVIMRDLREIDMGLWDGLSFQEVRRFFPDEFEKRGADIINYKPPGGESFAQCAGRVLAALDDILAGANESILIVGHAGVNRIIICRTLGLSLENMFKIRQSYGCLNILSLSTFGRRVETLSPDLKGGFSDSHVFIKYAVELSEHRAETSLQPAKQ